MQEQCPSSRLEHPYLLLVSIVQQQQVLCEQLWGDPSFLGMWMSEGTTPLLSAISADDLPHVPVDVRMAAATLLNDPDALLAFVDPLAPSDMASHRITQQQSRLREFVPSPISSASSAAIEVLQRFLREQASDPLFVPAIILTNTIVNAQESLRTFIHYYSILQRSGQIIGDLAPSLEPLITETLSQTVLLHQPERVGTITFKQLAQTRDKEQNSEGITGAETTPATRSPALDSFDGTEKWSYGKFSQLHGIVVDDVWSFQGEKPSTALQMVICGHELLHGISSILLNTDYAEAPNWNDFTKKSASLWRTLTEGVSLAFEHELITRFIRDPHISKSDKLQLSAYSKDRLEYLRTANRYWIEGVRQALVPDYCPATPDPHHIADLSYSDGARLAIRLRRQGWTLNDLPELIVQIRTSLEQELVPVDCAVLSTIGASREESALHPQSQEKDDSDSSLYHRLYQMIGRLKPIDQVNP